MADAELTPSRDEIASRYLDQLEFEPYPVQEEALLAWFSNDDGVLVCAPTGTGKTLIAEAAMFEALQTGRVAYYTTPLIALTEQKFRELQESAVRWGYSADDVGLVTGNRKVNPDARCLVVVAEILANRLLHAGDFDFDHVTSVVMDEFHSFNDPERGIVWELSLGLLPKHVRLLLLSATVGNSAEFLIWLARSHGRKPQLIQSADRKVPLQFEWVDEMLLNEQLERMSAGDENERRTPTLLFCFNRAECWTIAEQLKGKSLLDDAQRKELAERIDGWDWNRGAGPKLKTMLLRGVGVHHAGMLPRYRRRVEELFQRKLLSVCVCTETLAAGINLPARSVVLTSLIKGPPGKKKLIDTSSAHQMFGRAGRPQFDTVGYVCALAHEDDVKIARWKRQYDQIPEDTKDPNLIKAKKRLKKKMPTRRSTEQYWNEDQFRKLIAAPPVALGSRGQIPWRLLAYLLQLSPDVDRLREFVGRRLIAPKPLEQAQKRLKQMLMTLSAGGYVELDPAPPKPRETTGGPAKLTSGDSDAQESNDKPRERSLGTFGALLQEALTTPDSKRTDKKSPTADDDKQGDELAEYEPHRAIPTPALNDLMAFRSINPLYGMFLAKHFAIADDNEKIQALESVLELPRSILPQVRVPSPERMPPGPLATERVDREVISRGLATADELYPSHADDEQPGMFRERRFAIPLADKLRMLFHSEFPDVRDLRVMPVWVAGDLLQFGGDFEKYVRGRDLTKQEGLIFRHLLRLVLLCGEFAQITPPGLDSSEWRTFLTQLADTLTVSCRNADPESADKMLEGMRSTDVAGDESDVDMSGA